MCKENTQNSNRENSSLTEKNESPAQKDSSANNKRWNVQHEHTYGRSGYPSWVTPPSNF